MMEEVRVVRCPLRGRIKGVTVLKDDCYTILIRDTLTMEEALATYEHEMAHIEGGDFFSEKNVNEIERNAHERRKE